MRLEHYPADKLTQEILEILGRHLDLPQYRVFYFGSRVIPGKGTDRSDVDVGIEGPPVPAEAWLDILEEIEKIPTLYKIDPVEFRNVAPKFREVGLQYIEVIHPI